ncbi:hypothetical protein TNIN_458721 [Trichonephila inaurata madagascariensis]|uniref:Uncharacterized protein n=1 Tax=Trichonephila inaurata madagascariensis TaxID=2747483 RepID=A0A8X6XLH4_9ARAC|nr:hypothetical protein TNIN_458721 [Trichonephila inaurata madagascariensis]
MYLQRHLITYDVPDPKGGTRDDQKKKRLIDCLAARGKLEMNLVIASLQCRKDFESRYKKSVLRVFHRYASELEVESIMVRSLSRRNHPDT